MVFYFTLTLIAAKKIGLLSHCFRFPIAQGASNVDSMSNASCDCRTDSLGKGASKLDQLKLALTWNRIDVAEEKIFTPDTDWPVS